MATAVSTYCGELQGKIEAAITARSDPDFLVIARTEALITSLGEGGPASGARLFGGWRGHDPDPFEKGESFRDR
ncbi:hypothetical protein [Bradyrhizobium sp. 174]|uniref:hypothetical protein n=1 Tax=Bradyrhizobium sp. 174 TaxID=2782645 RepID=UPI001FF98035|nr:hypothetical protein [Bradyrhizobium sp. 174]